MKTFRLGGLNIGSAVDLPEVAEVADPPEWSFCIRPAEVLDTQFPTPLREAFAIDGQRWMSMARDERQYTIRFWGHAEFRLRPDLRRLECTPEPGLPSETLRHLLLDQVVPLILSASGRIALHASAVLTEWGVVGFLGSSGAGKSTLAGGLAVDGIPVVSDDCLVLARTDGRINALPMYPGLRLWPDSFDRLATGDLDGPLVAHYGVKRRLVVPADQPRDDLRGAPLLALLLLDAARPSVPFEVQPVSPREAFIEIFRSAYRLDADQEGLESEFDRLSDLVETVAIARLRFRRDFSTFAAVRSNLLERLQLIANETPAPARTPRPEG